MNGRTSDSRALRSAQTNEEVMDIKRMRAKAIASHLLHRVDTSTLAEDDGRAVGDCRTDLRRTPAEPVEFQSGITVFEVVMYILAAALAVAALDGAPSFFHWAFK